VELWLVFIISFVAIAFAGFLVQNVMKRDTGTAEMQLISDANKKGAEAFLARHNKTIGTLASGVALLLFVLYAFLREQISADSM